MRSIGKEIDAFQKKNISVNIVDNKDSNVLDVLFENPSKTKYKEVQYINWFLGHMDTKNWNSSRTPYWES